MSACGHAVVVEVALVPGDQPIRYRRCVGCGYRIAEISSSTEAYELTTREERLHALDAAEFDRRWRDRRSLFLPVDREIPQRENPRGECTTRPEAPSFLEEAS